MTVALSGIGIGNNPDGLIQQVLRPRWQPVRRVPVVLAGFLAALGAAWALRLADVIDNWGWALTSIGLVALMPVAANAVLARRATARGGAVATPEWWGIGGPFLPEQVEVLDRELHLPELVGRVPGPR
jgi:branched-chain amino acid transport system permease protein